MNMRESVAAYEAARTAVDFHWWDPDVFAKGVAGVLDRLKADPELVPCMRLGLNDDGQPCVWIYTQKRGDVGKRENGGDDGGFDLSHPCPPWCP